MKKTALLIFAALLMQGVVHAQEWKEEKGDHFIVFYGDAAARPKEVIRKAEFYYNRIAENLGYARHSNFWQWDKRVKKLLGSAMTERESRAGVSYTI